MNWKFWKKKKETPITEAAVSMAEAVAEAKPLNVVADEPTLISEEKKTVAEIHVIRPLPTDYEKMNIAEPKIRKRGVRPKVTMAKTPATQDVEKPKVTKKIAKKKKKEA